MAREAGLDAVEPCLWPEPEGDPLWSPSGARAMAAAAHGEGIALHSIALIFLNSGSFAGAAATRERARAQVRHSIDLAHDTGARYLLLPFFAAGRIETPDQVGQTTQDCASLAAQAAAAGVTLGLETTLPAETVLRIVRQVHSPAVRCYYDVGNAVRYGFDPVAELTLLHAAGALVPQLHVKDLRERPNDCALGEGRVPFPAVARTLTRIGFDGTLVLETAPTGDPVGAARRHRAYLESLFREAA
jgi:sugar phosphate isomerase/epimerase